MKPKIWLLIIIALVFVAALAAAFFLPRFFSPPASPSTLSPSPLVSPSLTSLISPSQTVPTTDWGNLPTVTPPSPGEPTLPPEAQAMQAAPTATPSPILPPPSPTQTPTPTPTPVPATGYDDVPMVEVSAGEFLMGNAEENIQRLLLEWYESYGLTHHPDTFWDEVPRLSVYLDTFSIDQVEVTNRRYRQCIQASYCPSVPLPDDSPAGRIPGYATETAFGEYPAFTSWYGARVYCQWVGKRLPTEAEWEKAARGTDKRQYPWGDEWDETRVAWELAQVGGHPQGSSPYGVLGMIGNAPEWVLDRYALYPGVELANSGLPLRWAERLAWDRRVIRGDRGNHLEMRLSVRASGNPNQRAAGFRCAAGAEPVSLADAVVEVLLPTPIPTLVPTVEPDLSDMVYVPAGEFIMGTNEIQSEENRIWHEDETPAHIVYLDAYYIDRMEVTTAAYVAFMNALHETSGVSPSEFCDGETCASWGDSNKNHIVRRDGYFAVDEPQRADYPVTGVSWYGAGAYCRWLGKRLPIEAEWEKAARGTDGRLYPWGDEWHPELTYPGHLGRDHEVGSMPENASPYGVLDMLGGVYEWTADYYAEDYYTRSPVANPAGPEWAPFVVERGRSAPEPEVGVVARRGEAPGHTGYYVGFRCVYQPGS